MKLIDLSHTICNNMPIYPSDIPVTLSQERYLAADHYNNFRLSAGMHTGTHVDSPMHLSDNAECIDNYPLDLFAGNGCLLDVRNEKCIGWKAVYSEKIKEKDIVLLLTGYSSKFGTESYFEDYPVVDQEFAGFLIGRKIKMLGMDSPSPDMHPFSIHKKLFNSGIPILENLVNLEQLLTIEKFEVMAFPLRIQADSSFVRAVARID